MAPPEQLPPEVLQVHQADPLASRTPPIIETPLTSLKNPEMLLLFTSSSWVEPSQVLFRKHCCKMSPLLDQGPQATWSINKFLVPGPMEMQSSPVLMLVWRTLTSDDNWTWMPSVLGLLPGARILTPSMCTFLQLLITMWNIWLFSEDNHQH